MLGLAGSHRVGKTTLAEEFARVTGATFVKSSITEWQREIGFDSSDQSYDFNTRLSIQEHILQRYEGMLLDHYHNPNCTDPAHAVTDRTPLDFMMYTLASVNDNLTAKQSARLECYLRACYDVLNLYFTGILIVQPGIPLVERAGAAKCCSAFMEKLNYVVKGLAADSHLTIPRYNMRRNYLDLNVRVRICILFMNMARKKRVLKVPIESIEGIPFATRVKQ